MAFHPKRLRVDGCVGQRNACSDGEKKRATKTKSNRHLPEFRAQILIIETTGQNILPNRRKRPKKPRKNQVVFTFS